MKIVIANSKNWFNLSINTNQKHEVLEIDHPDKLTNENLASFKPDFIFFPHWSWRVPKSLHTKYRCIVFHTAPLPKGRGGSPIQNLILRGYKTVPICALKMVEELDAGPIYAKKDVSLDGALWQIHERISLLVNELILEIIENRPAPKKQSGEVTKFKRLTRDDNKLPSQGAITEIFDRIRMVDDPSYPKAYLEYGDFIIEFQKAQIFEDSIICNTKISLKSDE